MAHTDDLLNALWLVTHQLPPGLSWRLLHVRIDLLQENHQQRRPKEVRQRKLSATFGIVRAVPANQSIRDHVREK